MDEECDEDGHAQADHPCEREGQALADQDGHGDVADHGVNQIERKADVGQEVEHPVLFEPASEQVTQRKQHQGIGVVLRQHAKQSCFIERIDRHEQGIDDGPITKRDLGAELAIEDVVKQAAKKHERDELHVRYRI